MWGILGKIGSGIRNGIDNAAYNSLGGGLLGDALPQQGQGLLDVQGQPQPWAPNPQQKAQLRGQFLGALGSGLQHGDINGAIQQYQQNAVGQIQAGQQAQAAQQHRAVIGAFQQEMQQAGGDPSKQGQVLAKYSGAIGPEATKQYAESFKAMRPEQDDVVGAPFPGVGADGQPTLLQHTKSGKVIPIQGVTPQESFTTDGQGNIYNTRTAQIVHEAPKPVKETQFEYLNGANGFIKVPKTGSGAPEAVMLNGKPVLPHTAANHTTVQLAPPSADGTANPYVQAIANFDIPLPPPRGGSPAAIALYQKTIGEVKKLNPHWDAMTQPVAQKTLNDFANGKAANSVNAINTAAGHLGVLAQAAKALDSGDITVMNRLANAYGLATGNDKLSVYKTIVHRLAPEITRSYVGAGGGEGDRVANESDFDPALGTNRILANAGMTASLYKSKINALGHQFEKAVPGRKFEGFITPEAQGVFDSLGQQSQQQGGSYRQTATGQGGHKIGSNDGGQTWFDVQTGRKL